MKTLNFFFENITYLSYNNYIVGLFIERLLVGKSLQRGLSKLKSHYNTILSHV